jgi:hypothetical protein
MQPKRHQFSNSMKTREGILRRAKLKPQSWEDIPQELRVRILEHLSEVVEEVLNGR